MNTWAIVELMGHGITAGRLMNVDFERTGLLRWVVPAPKAFIRYLGPGAIYSVTPCSESVARRVLEVKGHDGHGMDRVYDPHGIGTLAHPMEELDLEAVRKAAAAEEILPF